LKKIFKTLFIGLFLTSFIFVSAQLFFQEETNNFLVSAKDIFNNKDENSNQKLEILQIIYPNEPSQLEPSAIDRTTRQRTENIFEPLVKFDRDLTPVPALALSWGLIDDTTWFFKLRPNVLFHDMTKFDVNDVVASLNRAQTYSKSSLIGFFDTIKKVEIIDQYNFKIITNTPDPLLIQKLSTLLIIPSEYAKKDFEKPIGTGPYIFDSWIPEEELILKRNKNYWGKKSVFKEVKLLTRVDKIERLNLFLSGKADFLAFVPQDTVNILYEKPDSYTIKTIPSLEVQFLLFNLKSKLLGNIKNRKLINLSINKALLINQLGKFVKPVNQFVSNGVFGFNPNIKITDYDLKKAKNLISNSELNGKTLQFHLPIGLEILGEHIRTQLKEVGINVVVSYLEPDKFLSSIKEAKADIYFMGYRADLGDALPFFDEIILKNADFNFFDYSNKEINKLILNTKVEMINEERLKLLQTLMKKIIDDEAIGLPLFQYETVYAFNNKLDFEPRIDGLIYFDELILK